MARAGAAPRPTRGSVWWVDLGEPQGSEPGFVRPAVVISADTYNDSAIDTLTMAMITSNLSLGEAPGNVELRRRDAGLPKPSIVNVTQLVTVDRAQLVEHVGELDRGRMTEVDNGLRRALAL